MPTTLPAVVGENPAPRFPTLFPRGQREPAVELKEDYIILIYVNFDILRARVPKGGFSDSGKIWNHVDEEAIPAETAALLQRNGLRVGRGTPDSWPPIKALLDQENSVETSHSNTTVGNGLPLSVNLDQYHQRDQTLFMFRRDGTLAGATFAQSSNYLRIEYTLTAADGITLEIMPEFRERETLGELTFVNGMIDQPIQQPARILRELAFRMEIKPDQFCAVGPSPSAHQGHLPGSLLLCEDVDGRRLESIYFITPHVYRTAGPEAP